jgi:hypothetical protein
VKQAPNFLVFPNGTRLRRIAQRTSMRRPGRERTARQGEDGPVVAFSLPASAFIEGAAVEGGRTSRRRTVDDALQCLVAAGGPAEGVGLPDWGRTGQCPRLRCHRRTASGASPSGERRPNGAALETISANFDAPGAGPCRT